MSRNLCDTQCAICRGEVKIVGTRHLITKEEAGAYFDEYRHRLTVADAACETCGALYLAWIRLAASGGHLSREPEWPHGFVDLSFRHSFNDEPAPEDLPPPDVLAREWAIRCNATADAMEKRAREAFELEMRETTQMRELVSKEPHWEIYRR